METLEKKHLAPYLCCEIELEMNNGLKSILTGRHFDDIDYYFNEQPVRRKLILYPLDWLTKPIEHNGEKFVPIDVFYKNNPNEERVGAIITQQGIGELKYKYFQKLLEWHFNVFNLPKHLYIDKSTLKDNESK